MAMKQEAKIVLKAQDKTKLAFRTVNQGLGRMRNSMMGLTKMLPALAVGLSGVALVSFAKNAFKSADAIAKTADKIGLTTDSLQELRYGAKLAGVEQRTLDMGMQRFARRVGEAQQGTGELKNTLLEYGIAVRNANGTTRNIDDVLDDFSDAIMNAESDTERLRMAFKGFDSEGVALVNMMREGSQGINEFRKEAKELGLVFDEDLLRNAEDVNDSMLRLTTILTTKFQTTILQIAPHLDRFLSAIIRLTQPLTEQEVLMGRLRVAQAQLKVHQDQLANSTEGLGRMMDDTSKHSHSSEDAIKDLTKEIENLEAHITVLNDHEKRMERDRESLRNITVAVARATNEYSHAFDAHIKLYDAQPITKFKEAFTDLNMVLQNQTVSAMKRVEDSLIAITWKTKTAKEAFRDMAISILQDIQRMMMRQATSKIAEFGFNILSNAFMGGGGTPSSSPVLSTGGGTRTDWTGTGFGGLRANGGSVSANKAYMVGERGAELFVPNTSGEIIPNGASGVTVQNIFNISTGVSQTVRAEIVALMPQISAMTTQSVADAKARGAIS